MDTGKKQISLSAIFKWYKEDFGTNNKEVVSFACFIYTDCWILFVQTCIMCYTSTVTQCHLGDLMHNYIISVRFKKYLFIDSFHVDDPPNLS